MRLVLSHGAAGGLHAPDLVAVAAALPAEGVEVLLVEQPWRVSGRRLAPAPAILDEGFVAVVEHWGEHHEPGPAPAPFAVGGRSAGARVGCRTAVRLGAVGVLALAFPLHPPGRPERSRQAELLDTRVPVLVVQGVRDPFGGPDEVAGVLAGTRERRAELVKVPGADHGFAVRVRDGGAQARDAGLAAAVREVVPWLAAVVGSGAAGNT